MVGFQLTYVMVISAGYHLVGLCVNLLVILSMINKILSDQNDITFIFVSSLALSYINDFILKWFLIGLVNRVLSGTAFLEMSVALWLR